MFQFPPSAFLPYFTQIRIIGSYSYGVSPFGHVRVNALLAALRTLSWPKSVLHRQHVPRHPPRALSRLSLFLDLLSCPPFPAFKILLLELLFADTNVPDLRQFHSYLHFFSSAIFPISVWVLLRLPIQRQVALLVITRK